MKQKDDVTILLVEDNEIDVMGVERAFKKSNFRNPIKVAQDGVEALSILRNNISRPYLILLDLNMPRMSGIEFLDEIRKDSHLRDSIVFVLTTSKASDDMRDAHERNIAGYIVKDRREGGFIDAAHLLESYTKVCELPNGGE